MDKYEFRVFDADETCQHWFKADEVKYDVDCENLAIYWEGEQIAELHVEPTCYLESNGWDNWVQHVPVTDLGAY